MKTLSQTIPVLLLAALAALTGPAARAEVPEPDNLIYGIIQLGNAPVTAGQTNVVVEARKLSTNGPVVATYRMGSSAIASNFYSLNIPVEAFNPLTDTNASRVGALIYLSVRDDSGVRVRRSTSIAARGKLVRLDFTELDTDGDGMPDNWEQTYFLHPTNGDPNGDPDDDGRTNLQEYLDGTNPLVPDGRHPADNSPANYVMTFTEAENYAAAWQSGTNWPSAPSNIPIAYVTKAAVLALGGGSYAYTNVPPVPVPHGWRNTPTPLATYPGTNIITATMPSAAVVGQPINVAILSTPHAFTHAHAVEDRVPYGWAVESISHGGVFDEVNSKVKWGPFFDDGERELTYVLVPMYPTSLVTLSGTGSYDGYDQPITGNRQISFGPYGDPVEWIFAAPQPRNLAAPVEGAIDLAFYLGADPTNQYTLEMSTNLLDWQAIGVITTDMSGIYLMLEAPTNAASLRYYRTRQE